MFKLVLLLGIIKFNNGFLLDAKNTTPSGKSLYLTVAEYYGDKNQLHQEIEYQHQQQELYRAQTEKTLHLLATQLQQRLETMEQKIDGKNETQQQTLDSLLQKYQELEQKYTTLQQAFEDKNSSCSSEIGMLTKKTQILQHKIDDLEQLKSVNQLKDFQTLQHKVQSFDSRINLLSSHEQARNQDFLDLYNLTTVSRSEIHALTNKTLKQFEVLEKNYNNSIIFLQNAENKNMDSLNKSLAAFQDSENHKINSLNNFTSDKLDFLAKNLNTSITKLQQKVDKNYEKVVLTSCRKIYTTFSFGSVITFPNIITAIGITNPSSFSYTGKFTCQISGVYHISTAITSNKDNLVTNIMKNSARVHRYISGYTQNGSYWTPGATVVAIELKVNDTVWVQYASSGGLFNEIYYSCFTIFKI